MSDLSEIYAALCEAKRAVDALETWQLNADGADAVRSRRRSIEQGLAAYERLSRDLRDGRKHVEPPEDFKMTECGCSWPNASPPCSYCTDPANNEENEPAKCNECDGHGWFWATDAVRHLSPSGEYLGTEQWQHKRECEACKGQGEAV